MVTLLLKMNKHVLVSTICRMENGEPVDHYILDLDGLLPFSWANVLTFNAIILKQTDDINKSIGPPMDLIILN